MIRIPTNEEVLNCPELADHIPAIDGTNETDPQPRQWLEALTPTQCREWQMPPGYMLVGDHHITRGGFTVIGGPPGLGKSRAALQLAIAGATGEGWFDLPVHEQFKTFILQNENGRHRLKDDFSCVPPFVEDYIRITPPPEYGMRFEQPEFREQLETQLKEFQPGIVVIDPLINVARDCSQGDYSDAFDFIRECLPKGDQAPAVVVVAHTRKPKSGERSSGVGLLNDLLGSTKLGSVPRCAFVMQAASNDTEDNRVVWTCCKNNDGEKGARTAWRRSEGMFRLCTDIDWGEFDCPTGGGRTAITEPDIAALFSNRKAAARKVLAEELMERTGCGKSAAYNALSTEGRFKGQLIEIDGLLSWRG